MGKKLTSEEFNICVEYDGVQHVKPYGWDVSGDRFKATIKNDKIKDEYCLNNQIKLIRIKYDNKVKLNNIINFKNLIKL